MDIEEFRKAGYQAIDRICDFFYSLQTKPVVPQVEPGYLRKFIPSTVPETGEDFQVIADDFQKFILPGITLWQHPSFFGYFPTACSFEGILGDLYASSVSNPGFNWICSPACTELEAIVMDWAADLLGLGQVFMNKSQVGGGVIHTTASDSALTAVVAARSSYERDHPYVKAEKLIIYTTTQTHSLGAKAGLVFGLKVREIDVRLEDQLALRGQDLRTALQEDTQNGLHPFILIATLGTTSSGAMDNLPEICNVSQDYPSLWIHVDAAWAGVALACPELRQDLYLDDINAFAHSFCTNFHKWGLVNFACSALWVRDRKKLTDALDVTPEFLRTKEGDAGVVIDYRNWHMSLGRQFRSLKLWFVLRSYGAQGFQNHIHNGLNLNRLFIDLLKTSDNLTLVTKPSLSLTVFRLVPKPTSCHSLESLNDLNRIYYSRISSRSDIMLVQTSLNSIFCIRFAIGAQRTTEKHVRDAYHILEEESQLAIAIWKKKHIDENT